MKNTYQILLNWDKGQAFSERMVAKLLAIEAYTDIDPQCPTGGPDGTKDIVCNKGGEKYVVGCYFPNGQKPLSNIRDKLSDDYKGRAKHHADGFVFVTNQKITPDQRADLVSLFPSTELFHGERVCGALDSPKGYGVRLEYLGIELDKAEQISFLNTYIDLKEEFNAVKALLDGIKRTTNRIEGLIDKRDLERGNSKFSLLPIAGITLSSRISIEDVQGIHLACLYEGGSVNSLATLGIRKTQVWIGLPGGTIANADFVPPPPEEIPRLLNELLDWWRVQYMDVIYGEEYPKIVAIAQFHERFLSIHPFLDGNGRTARVIASIQYRDLLGRLITFEGITQPARYYAALESARAGGHKALVDMFLSFAR